MGSRRKTRTVDPREARTPFFGLKRRQHRRIARRAFPAWLDVSVTGVIIHVMLYQLHPSGPIRVKVYAMKASVRVAVLVVLVAVLAPALIAACPNCVGAASNADKPGSSSVWRGMYWSILLMAGMPFTMVIAMMLMLARTRRRRQATLPRPAAPLPFPDSSGAHS